MRKRSFSSSDVGSETNINTILNESGARKDCDNENEKGISDENYIDQLIIPVQRRGSSPSKIITDQSKRLSPPIVRVNSPPNNEDLDAVEKQLGEMLEATIASIESGAILSPKEPVTDKFTYRSGGQLLDGDDDDSPLSFFTGSFNYFFRPKERYKTDSYHQPAQYSSWSSNISNNEEYTENNRYQKRPNMSSIGRTKSLEPSWTSDEYPTPSMTSTKSDLPAPSLESSGTSGFDTEDQIDEYMMMLHSNPELFLASVRKGCVPSELEIAINENEMSLKPSLNRNPTLKNLGRAQTLEPSWTPEASPTRNFFHNCTIKTELSKNRYDKDDNEKLLDYCTPHAIVRNTQSFPEPGMNLSYSNFPHNITTSSSNETWVPNIIVTPPSRRGRFESDYESGPSPFVYHKKIRSKSLGPHIPIGEIPSPSSKSIKLRKFLSQGNLIATSAMPLHSRELPSRVLFENTEKRRFIDRYYMSIISRILFDSP